jgi:hypothetical protein
MKKFSLGPERNGSDRACWNEWTKHNPAPSHSRKCSPRQADVCAGTQDESGTAGRDNCLPLQSVLDSYFANAQGGRFGDKLIAFTVTLTKSRELVVGNGGSKCSRTRTKMGLGQTRDACGSHMKRYDQESPPFSAERCTFPTALECL